MIDFSTDKRQIHKEMKYMNTTNMLKGACNSAKTGLIKINRGSAAIHPNSVPKPQTCWVKSSGCHR